nr:EOG090X0IC1 [Macrothrix elegans]
MVMNTGPQESILLMEQKELKTKASGNASLHYMPCKIKHNGPADVDGFFKPYVEKDSNEVMKGSFRGYPLQGIKLELPNEYKGLILVEEEKSGSAAQGISSVVNQNFNSITYWNWDSIPSRTDQISDSFAWLQLANIIHKAD